MVFRTAIAASVATLLCVSLSETSLSDGPERPSVVFLPAVRLEVPETLVKGVVARPRLLVFSSDGCVHCEQQLQDWRRDAKNVDIGPEGTDVRVIVVSDDTDGLAAKYGVKSYPTTVLLDDSGKKRLAWIGRVPWSLVKEKWQPTAPSPGTDDENLVSVRVVEGREQLREVIEKVTNLLQSGGVALKLNVGATQPMPLEVGGRVISVSPDTEISVSLARREKRLRLQISPPLTTRVLGIKISIRGAWVGESQIALDIPWLPDPKIRVRDSQPATE